MEPGIEGTASSCWPLAQGGSERDGGIFTAARIDRLSMALPSHRYEEAGVQGQWSLQSYMALGALSSAVPCARLHTRQVLREWGQKKLMEEAELVVSELVTNAVTATQAIDSDHPVRLWLLSDNSRMLIMIGDASPHPPRRVDPADSNTEGGRGLLLVEALSRSWGWYAARRSGTTKVVWAELRMRPDDGKHADAQPFSSDAGSGGTGVNLGTSRDVLGRPSDVRDRPASGT
jgi:anti-sigma regulatory factor (Ser/Thr protein kinase)